MAKVKQLKIISDASALAKEAKNLVTTQKRFDGRIQIYLCSEIAHIFEHRNPTRMNEFFANMRGKGARTNAMHKFIQEFCDVVYDEEEKKYKVKKPASSQEVHAKKFKEACETLWTEFKPEAEVRQWSFDAQLLKLLNDAQKKLGKEGVTVNMDLFQKVRDTYEEIHPELKEEREKEEAK